MLEWAVCTNCAEESQERLNDLGNGHTWTNQLTLQGVQSVLCSLYFNFEVYVCCSCSLIEIASSKRGLLKSQQSKPTQGIKQRWGKDVKLSAHVAHSTSGITAHTGYWNGTSHIAMSSLNNFQRYTLVCRHLVECFHTPAFTVWCEVHLLLTGSCKGCISDSV